MTWIRQGSGLIFDAPTAKSWFSVETFEKHFPE